MCPNKLRKWIQKKFQVAGFSTRYVLITGCDTGFGNMAAKKLDDMGFNVIACCLTEDGVNELHSHCSESLVAVQMDVTSEESIQNCLDFVKPRLENTGLWGLVNNAGISVGQVPFELTKMEHVQQTVDVNLYGMARVTKAFLPLIRKARGRIVNTSSLGGRCGGLTPVPYTISKFGVEGFSERLRLELYNTGVTVHIVEPSAFMTTIVNVDRMKRDLRTLFEEADEEIQSFYGEDFVAKRFKSMEKEYNVSTDLWKVSDAYTHALTSRFPKYRYIVGRNAILVEKILRNLPTGLSDYIILKMIPSISLNSVH